ncbi:uncharacterized protein LOC109709343 [Ananas comosus]|uniref:Uncharacterized protein LOC109709343 n=1 Tax=Ananas comosus TaxID=4615 RepID=A0A6P5F179_ANACO|nr:uncharacterized protein LOC109709343 [Ananas comosus]
MIDHAMVPTRNLIRSHHGSYSSFSDAAQFEFRQEKPPSVSSLMADDTKDNKKEEEEEEEEDDDDGTSSKGGGGDDHEGWLQLGIGTAASASADRNPTNIDRAHPVGPTSSSAPRRSLTELDLFSDRPSSAVRPRMAAAGGPSLMIAPFLPAAAAASGFTLGYQRNNLLAWGVHGRCMAGASSSTRRPPPLPQPLESVGRVGTEVRVVSPARRPEIGVWLDLKAAQNQEKEPFLPQIQRSYLRIKDCNMTIRVLMRYLATKLGLGDESQVEITCRGQQLPPFLMLQYVRDHIWCPAEVVQLLPNSQTTNHLMTLHYSRK